MTRIRLIKQIASPARSRQPIGKNRASRTCTEHAIGQQSPRTRSTLSAPVSCQASGSNMAFLRGIPRFCSSIRILAVNGTPRAQAKTKVSNTLPSYRLQSNHAVVELGKTFQVDVCTGRRFFYGSCTSSHIPRIFRQRGLSTLYIHI